MKRALRVVLGVLATLSSVVIVASAAGASTSAPKSLTVSEVTSEWPGLDPATDSQDAADTDYLNCIYGDLFEAGPNGKVIPDLATGYSFSNKNKTVTITLRKGVKFSDGTPYNSAAVVSSIQRDLNPSNANSSQSTFSVVTSVNTDGPYAFQLNLQYPFTAIITAFLGSAPNWTVDPTALASMGEATYAQKPVGAGPFTVVTNSASATLVLQRNPNYWEKGHPYLNNITFISVGTSESAFLAVQSGSTEIETGPLDPSVVTEARQAKELITAPGSSTITAELNSKVAPFNSLIVREAAYYALNAKLLLKSIGLNLGTISESYGGPADLYWEKTIPGYRTYDLAKAKKLVAQYGQPINITLFTSGNPSIVWSDAIANEWDAAGMHVTVQLIARQQEVTDFQTGNWTAITQLFGAGDPSIGVGGVADRLQSSGEFSGTDSPTLDNLLERAAQLASSSARQHLYYQAWAYLNTEAYAPFLVSVPLTLIVASSVKSAVQPNISVANGTLAITWENVK